MRLPCQGLWSLVTVALIARLGIVRGFTRGVALLHTKPPHPGLVRMMKEPHATALGTANIAVSVTTKVKRRRKGAAEEEEKEEQTVPSARLRTTKKKRSAAIAVTATATITTAGGAKKATVQAVVSGAEEGALLHTVPQLSHATVLARPSKAIKSPYLADVKLEGSGEEALCHSPSLGCMGLISEGARVLVAKTQAGSSAKSSRVMYHVELTEEDGSRHLVGTHPTTANLLARQLVQSGRVCGPVVGLAREVTRGGSRFDFVAEHEDGTQTVIEVKNVPLADHADGDKKARKAWRDAAEGPLDPYAKMAIFPEGYVKKKGDPVSPRALKHAQELAMIAEEGGRACLLFIVQRTDCDRLRLTTQDVQYREAVRQAMSKGVAVRAFAVRWEGERAYLHRELPLDWDQ